MVVLCDGMPRSGSTWAFNVALKLLRSSDLNRRTFGFYNENPAVHAAAVKPRFSNLVIKAHTVDPSSRELCRTRALQAIYTWRNPYDVVASSLRMFGFSVEHWTAVLQASLGVWSFHRATNSACIVSYDTIVNQPAAGIANIADYLGLSIEPRRMDVIAEEVSFGNLRHFSQHVDQLDPERVVRKDGYVFDRETLLHQSHIRNGATGYGSRTLERSELSAIDAMLRAEGFAFLCEPRSAAAPRIQPTSAHPLESAIQERASRR